MEDILATGTASLGVALDVASGNIYWTDYDTKGIRRVNLDGTGVEDLVMGVNPREIALDLIEGKMYWAGNQSIQRANLDGTEYQTLVTGLSKPHGIAVIPVPEPGSLTLLACGLLGLLCYAWRKRK